MGSLLVVCDYGHGEPGNRETNAAENLPLSVRSLRLGFPRIVAAQQRPVLPLGFTDTPTVGCDGHCFVRMFSSVSSGPPESTASLTGW